MFVFLIFYIEFFLIEYLQEATAASTTSVTTNNIYNINNNNNNTSNNISNNNQSNEKGNEVNNCLDAFENFEFDIDLLTENNSKNKDITTIELQEEEKQQQHLQQQKLQQTQQHQLTEVENDKKEHQLELQLMLEDILFNNKNNSSNNNTSCKTFNIFNNNNNINTISINDNTLNNNNNNNNMNNMATTSDFSDEFDSTDLFKVAPYSQMNEHILTPDDIDENLSVELAMELSNAEYAVDINCMTNEPSLNECFLHSQPSDIMFSSGYGPSSSLSSSQNLINEISKAEPHVPDSTYSVLPTTSSIALESGICEANEDTQYDWASQCNMENPVEEWKENKTLNNSLKRQNPQTSKHMQEKRLKLRLDTKPCKESILSQQSEISTPNVINLIMNEEVIIVKHFY